MHSIESTPLVTVYLGFICLGCGKSYIKEQDAWDCNCDCTNYNYHEIAERYVAKCNKCDTLYAHVCEAYECCKQHKNETKDYEFD